MKLSRAQTSTAETAEYEGFYEGRKVRITRLTDPNSDGGRPESRWDGYVWDEGGRGHWSLVAECYPSMSSAVYEVQRTIQARMLAP